MVFNDQIEELREIKSNFWQKITGIELSGKMQVVAKLLENFHKSGKNDKVLLFSYSTRVRKILLKICLKNENNQKFESKKMYKGFKKVKDLLF